MSSGELLTSFLTGFIIPNSHFIPTVGNALLNIWVIISISQAARERALMSGARAGEGVVKKKEFAITITIAVVQIIHFIIYFPSGLLWFMKTIYNLTGWDAVYPDSYDIIGDWADLALILTSLVHCVNFFVFLIRMPGFRMRLFRPCFYVNYIYTSKFSTASRMDASVREVIL